MPIHDWTRVNAGTFHDFHCTWIPEIKNRLNDGVLPPDFGTQVEQSRRIVVHPGSDDRIVALIELVSPGNKAARQPFRTFVEKAASALAHGWHLLLIDLIPPGPRDPRGIPDAVWSELGGDPFEPPPDRPLTLASYCAGPPVTAYVEPVAVGDDLPAMPLFLSGSRYVSVPLDESYRTAFRGVPRRWRALLEPTP